MNQAEASSSDDDMEDDPAIDELATAMLEDELGPGAAKALVDPEQQRQAEIMAEVARRRKEVQDLSAATREKSDAIFQHFDKDQDGYLNYSELRALGQATGGELPQIAYKSICDEIGADARKGVTKTLLLLMYTDAELGDAHRDYNLIFKTE